MSIMFLSSSDARGERFRLVKGLRDVLGELRIVILRMLWLHNTALFHHLDCCAIDEKDSSRSCKASERPYYHPSCRLTSGCRILPNDKLAQGECNRMMTTDIFLLIR